MNIEYNCPACGSNDSPTISNIVTINVIGTDIKQSTCDVECKCGNTTRCYVATRDGITPTLLPCDGDGYKYIAESY